MQGGWIVAAARASMWGGGVICGPTPQLQKQQPLVSTGMNIGRRQCNMLCSARVVGFDNYHASHEQASCMGGQAAPSVRNYLL